MTLLYLAIIMLTIYTEAANLASWSTSQMQRNPIFPVERKNMLYFNSMVKEPELAFPEDLPFEQKYNFPQVETRAIVNDAAAGSGTGRLPVQKENPKDIKVLENYHRFRENGSQELKLVLSNGMINYQYLEFVPTNLPKPRLKPIQTGYYTIPIPDATTGNVRYLTTQYRADDDGFKVVKTVLSFYNPAQIYKRNEEMEVKE